MGIVEERLQRARKAGRSIVMGGCLLLLLGLVTGTKALTAVGLIVVFVSGNWLYMSWVNRRLKERFRRQAAANSPD